MSTIKPWMDAIGQHMWRFYFSRRDADPERMTEPNRRQWQACSAAMTRFSREERDVMEMYFTSEWGKDLVTVAEYSEKNMMDVNRIWEIIKSANRAACEERGLIDRRGV